MRHISELAACVCTCLFTRLGALALRWVSRHERGRTRGLEGGSDRSRSCYVERESRTDVLLSNMTRSSFVRQCHACRVLFSLAGDDGMEPFATAGHARIWE